MRGDMDSFSGFDPQCLIATEEFIEFIEGKPGSQREMSVWVHLGMGCEECWGRVTTLRRLLRDYCPEEQHEAPSTLSSPMVSHN